MDRRAILRLAAMSLALPIAARVQAADVDRPVVGRIEVRGRRLLIPVSFNGGASMPFIIDTGAVVSLMDEALARSLKLSRRGSTTLGGIGGRDTFPLYLAENVVFGDAVRQPTAAFAARQGSFGEFRGAVAAGLLTALDSDLDLEAGEWRIYPQGRTNRPGFVRMNGGLIGGGGGQSPRLVAEAMVDGKPLRFLIDTGAPGGLSLHEGAVRKLGLWDDGRPYAPQRTSGIGGRGGLGRLVRVASIAFGGRRFDRPVILLRQDGVSREEDGIIGLNLLRGFNLSTQVSTRSLWVQPQAAPKPLTDDYGRSGLWIEANGSTATVVDVGTGSPAAKAGIKVGDRIRGNPAELIRSLGGPPGTPISLALDRGGAVTMVSFLLADFL